MKITITTQILDGNLGDDWIDNYAAAIALAKFTEQTWRNDLWFAMDESVIDIKIDIDVERNTSGAGRDMSVSIDDYVYDDWLASQEWTAQSIENALTDENTIWEMFCDSETAQKFIK